MLMKAWAARGRVVEKGQPATRTAAETLNLAKSVKNRADHEKNTHFRNPRTRQFLNCPRHARSSIIYYLTALCARPLVREMRGGACARFSVVLVVALLLTPAATARLAPASIRRTAVLAALLGGTAAFGGVLASLATDSIPTGSAMTLVSATIFAAALALTALRSRVSRAKRATRNIEDLRA
jgi:hypothetical protein